MTPPQQAGLRWEVLRALGQAMEGVAHGHPSLSTAFHYLRLTERAWVEVDRALDDVRFEVPAEQFVAVAESQGAQSAEGVQLREALHAARRNAGLPWESPESLTREQCVALLFIAREFLKRLPAVSAGPLLPSLPISARSDT
ncbi:MAG: hypothetical protein ACJ8AT_06270 [Hyalangium sp.]|uniref:hypothetical protein n=1 Tax=Hyalangium sp. TaxID=2028555 RepID=UPI00389AC167